jgi:putative ABC transport system ATP-binding protein
MSEIPTTIEKYGGNISVNKAPKIRIDDTIKIYKRGKIEVVALRGLSCDFYAGEISVIMGPSGCGKSTLLNMLGGLDRVNSGKIWVSDRRNEIMDITKLPDLDLEKFRSQNVGFLFQFMNLIPELTAIENVLLPMELSGTLTAEKRKYVDELLDFVGLGERKHHRPDELSGGEQQRVALAAALANDPEIILCDEPTGELDSDSKANIMDLLRKMVDKFPEKTMIIVTHDADLKKIADRMYYIRDGKISHKFTKDELKELQQTSGDELVIGGAASKRHSKELALLELREVAHIVGDKIEKIEKEIHPM